MLAADQEQMRRPQRARTAHAAFERVEEVRCGEEPWAVVWLDALTVSILR